MGVGCALQGWRVVILSDSLRPLQLLRSCAVGWLPWAVYAPWQQPPPRRSLGVSGRLPPVRHAHPPPRMWRRSRRRGCCVWRTGSDWLHPADGHAGEGQHADRGQGRVHQVAHRDWATVHGHHSRVNKDNEEGRGEHHPNRPQDCKAGEHAQDGAGVHPSRGNNSSTAPTRSPAKTGESEKNRKKRQSNPSSR